ncbi:MAG: hypothetical protein VYD27_01580 [Candidatus Thermoplasmatota archaeon]|jgi:Rieske Fe-S protein|nr:hypothetical protein [Candidatus Thermoplasmatota archaeon]|tara:strand:- start:3652 stop:4500 length:849 start_codon:yes stop_codon:yes gene_type:complete
MARRFKLRPLHESGSSDKEGAGFVDRREFMRMSFNTAAGLITMASLGSVGFASFLMGQASSGGSDQSILFYVPKGSDVWYGNMDKQPMTMQAFRDEAANSATGMSAAAGLWSGLPIIAVYVPHEENKNKPLNENEPRFQLMDGFTASGAYVGSGYEIDEKEEYASLSIHDNMIIIFSRCPHLCCIPGWQLVSNDFTADNWLPGGTDSGGNKLFCICHSSRYDPTVIEKNTARNRANGQDFDFIGVKRTGGPAPYGMPLIPFVLNGDNIEALPDFKDWYTFCG